MSKRYKDLKNNILDSKGFILAKDAKTMDAKYCGIYAIRIMDLNALPEEIIKHQKEHAKDANIIYIGMANPATIEQRLLQQDLSGKGAAIFFRKLGSILGYLAIPMSGKNYIFSPDNKMKIVEWIDNNLAVKYFEYPVKKYSPTSLEEKFEKPLIKEIKPSFNDLHNPNKCQFIINLHHKNRDRGICG